MIVFHINVLASNVDDEQELMLCGTYAFCQIQQIRVHGFSRHGIFNLMFVIGLWLKCNLAQVHLHLSSMRGTWICLQCVVRTWILPSLRLMSMQSGSSALALDAILLK